MNPDDFLRESDAIAARLTEVEGRKQAPGRLLSGEEPASPYPDDAQHWAAVYAELADFKAGLLQQVVDRIQDVGHTEQSAELEHDRKIFALELQRLQLHLAFWRERVATS